MKRKKKDEPVKAKDTIGKPLHRDDDYQMRVFDRALSEDIKKDVTVTFGNWYDLNRNYGKSWNNPNGKELPHTANYNKVRAYCPAVNSYLQFPRALRVPGTHCICDISSTEHDKVGGFWRYIKGTVRKEGSDIVVA